MRQAGLRAARDLSTTRCSDGLAEQLNTIRGTFANSARQLQASFGTLGAASSGAGRAMLAMGN